MIPVVAGGLRETSLVPEDLPPLLESSVPGKIIYYKVCLVRGGKSSGTKLVSLNPPATTGIIRPRKANILSGMFSKGR
jgi:hypothetical protein